jgi:hypothetical protein
MFDVYGLLFPMAGESPETPASKLVCENIGRLGGGKLQRRRFGLGLVRANALDLEGPYAANLDGKRLPAVEHLTVHDHIYKNVA